jgi:hypothetical protein
MTFQLQFRVPKCGFCPFEKLLGRGRELGLALEFDNALNNAPGKIAGLNPVYRYLSGCSELLHLSQIN